MRLRVPVASREQGRGCCRQVPTADSALSSATALQRDAMRLALDDFLAMLKQQAAVPAAPNWGGSTAGSPSPTTAYTPKEGEHTPCVNALTEDRSLAQKCCQGRTLLQMGVHQGAIVWPTKPDEPHPTRILAAPSAYHEDI